MEELRMDGFHVGWVRVEPRGRAWATVGTLGCPGWPHNWQKLQTSQS